MSTRVTAQIQAYRKQRRTVGFCELGPGQQLGKNARISVPKGELWVPPRKHLVHNEEPMGE